MTNNWAEQKEAATTSLPIKFSCFLVKLFPHFLLVLIAFPVSFFYFLFCSRARKTCEDYQRHLISFAKNQGSNFLRKVNTYKQILSFSICLIEKIEGWCGKEKLSDICFYDDDVVELKKILAEGKGAFLIGSHLGNIELLRSLASFGKTGVDKFVPVTAIMDVKVTANFNKTLSQINKNSALDILSPDNMGVETVELLQDRIKKGGLIVAAADRTSANNPERSFKKSFLGEETSFPCGIFLLASLLKAPVYFIFAMRKKDISFRKKYDMLVIKSAVTFSGSRLERKQSQETMCSEFVSLLEKECLKHPFQWYNFYYYWNNVGDTSGR